MNGFASIPLLMLSVSSMAVGSHRAVIESVQAIKMSRWISIPLQNPGTRHAQLYIEKDSLRKVVPRMPLAARSYVLL
jgi:hypothetical protein